MMRLWLICLAMMGSAFAVEPDEMLADPDLEARAQEIDTQLRCVVCQSQAIAESNAPLAKDMRIIVRERLTLGDSNEEAIDYLVDRYGDYVLLKPRVKPSTYFLWIFPALILVLGGFAAFWFLRSGQAQQPAAAPLTEEEQKALDKLLEDHAS